MNNYSKLKSTFINIFYLFLSASLFFLANPNQLNIKGFGFLSFIYYFPVLLLVVRAKFKSVGFYGFFLGSLFYLSYAYWLYNYGPICLIFIVLFEGLVYFVFFIVLKYALSSKSNYSWLVACFVITSFEFLKTKGFLGFNYTITAYTLYDYKKLIQVCDLIGVFGLNFVVIFCSCLLFSFTNRNFSFIKKLLFSFGYFFVLILIIFYSKYSMNKINQSQKQCSTIRIASVQHNEDPEQNDLNSDINNFNTLKQLTSSILEFNQNVDIVLWPETAVVTNINNNYFFSQNSNQNKNRSQEFIHSVVNYLCKNENLFVFGNNGIELKDNNQKEYSNNVIVFKGGEGKTPKDFEFYKKVRLVPFTENFPNDKKQSKLAQKVQELFGPPYKAGTEYKVFNYNNFYFSTPICFEDTFSEVCRKMNKNGARAFLNLSNDSWSKSSVCQAQHVNMAIFRSIENRVPTIRSTSSGLTCYIDSCGIIRKNVPEFIKSYIIVDVPVLPKEQKLTFYTKIGFVLEYIILTITVLL